MYDNLYKRDPALGAAPFESGVAGAAAGYSCPRGGPRESSLA